MEEDYDFYTTEMILRPTVYMDSVFEQSEVIAANDHDFDDCENLYATPC